MIAALPGSNFGRGRVTRLLGLTIVLVLAPANFFAQQPPLGSDYRILQVEIRKSFQNKDYDRALRLLKEADRKVSHNPATVFRMAVAEAHLHSEEASLEHLKRLGRMRVYFDLTKEPALFIFDRIPEFQRLVRAMEQLRTVKDIQASVAFRISDPAFFPEGIAYDRETESFFVGSLRKRKIVRISRDGSVSDFIAPGREGIWAVSGIGIDSGRRLVWACSTAFEVSENYTAEDKDKAAVFAFEIDTGKLYAKYLLQGSELGHFCDGLTVDPSGIVYIADSSGLTVYRLKPDAGNLEILLNPKAGISPQGLALSARGNLLFVSDYVSGLYAINFKSGRISRVTSRATESLAGIDGLITYGNDLIAIQNGIEPQRVIRLKMSRDGSIVESI